MLPYKKTKLQGKVLKLTPLACKLKEKIKCKYKIPYKRGKCLKIKEICYRCACCYRPTKQSKRKMLKSMYK